MRSPATRCPGIFAGTENTLNSTDFIASVSSVNFNGTRRSGLSEPKSRIASGVAHHRQRVGQRDIQRFLEHAADEAFEDRADLHLPEERGLAVDLGEPGCRSARRSSSRKHLVIW